MIWKYVDDALTILASNLNSIDVAISYAKENLTNTVLDRMFLLSRCLGDVIKHMVKFSLDKYDDSITCVRKAVLSARTNNFKRCAKESGTDFKHFMCLD